MTKKRGCFISIVAAVLLCFSAWAACKLYDWYKYSPRLNPSPQHFLTVQGRVDPALSKQLSITWRANYYTTNKSCEYDVTLFEGAYTYREKKIYYVISPDPQGNFKITIPLDKYFPGFCGWQIEYVDYEYTYQNNTMASDITTGTDFNSSEKVKQHLEQTWICDGRSCNLTNNSNILGNNTLSTQQPNINLSFLRKIQQ